MPVLSFDGAGAKPVPLMLARWQHNIADATPAFEAMAQYQTKTVNARQFNEQGSVETGKWAPLSPPYGRWKARVRPGRPILVFDGDLKREMTVPGQGVYQVWRSGMTVGTEIEYAKYHQTGTPGMPARPLIGTPRKQDTRQFGKILQRFIVESRPVA
jgi:phage gpG-like protein